MRPPVVTILGHVDHGKTTLLDRIRKTDIALREKGGITQSIGASSITVFEDKKITFIDTPGHAAFKNMRQRGTKIADIVVLVIAIDDGVKPQTKEAIEYIRQTNTPFLVAITKVDIPGTNPEIIISQLSKEGIFLEGKGGNTPYVLVSSKTGQGIKELLELILLLAELEGVNGDLKNELDAFVVETKKTKRGVEILVVVKDGKIDKNQEVFCEGRRVKIRAIFDTFSKPITTLLPGEAGLILGFDFLPSVGSQIKDKPVLEGLKVKEDVKEKIPEGKLPLLIKAETYGALEAIKENLPEKIYLVEGGVGEVTENDVFLARATGALIFSFGQKVSSSILNLAKNEQVKIESFDIIYHLLERIDKILEEKEEKILGIAQILQIFPHNKEKIAGARVLEGEIKRTAKNLFLKRGEKILGKIEIVSLKKGKLDVDSVSQGEEFGILFRPQFDFEINDVIIYKS